MVPDGEQESVATLKPCRDGLLLETLRYADEVRSAAPRFADIGNEAPDAEPLDLAVELIGSKRQTDDAVERGADLVAHHPDSVASGRDMAAVRSAPEALRWDGRTAGPTPAGKPSGFVAKQLATLFDALPAGDG